MFKIKHFDRCLKLNTFDKCLILKYNNWFYNAKFLNNCLNLVCTSINSYSLTPSNHCDARSSFSLCWPNWKKCLQKQEWLIWKHRNILWKNKFGRCSLFKRSSYLLCLHYKVSLSIFHTCQHSFNLGVLGGGAPELR